METAVKNKKTCVVCNESFTAQGGRATCGPVCSNAYKAIRSEKSASQKAKIKSISKDMKSKDYILDRIVVDAVSGCWEWQKSLNPKTGYGQIGYPPYTAHKLSYKLWIGEPKSQVIRHSCNNKKCCNPDHLIDGTHQENYHDSYDAHVAGQRDKTPNNALSVVVDGKQYDSKLQAMQQLKISWKTLHNLI